MVRGNRAQGLEIVGLVVALVLFVLPLSAAFLTSVQAANDGGGGVDGLDRTHSVTIVPDGAHVYVASLDDYVRDAFRRDEATGALTRLDLHKYGVDGLAEAQSVMSNSDRAAYLLALCLEVTT